MSRSERITNTSHYLHSITWPDFEQLVADYWEFKGWETRVTGHGSDRGIDIIATKRSPYPKTIYIQAKHYSNSKFVTGPMIQENAVHLLDNNVDEVIIVTTTSFTSQARDKASELNLKLIDGDDLCEMLVNENLDRFLYRGYPAADEDLTIDEVRETLFEERFGVYYQDLLHDIDEEAYESIYAELPTPVVERIEKELYYEINNELSEKYALKSLEVVYQFLFLSQEEYTVSFESPQTSLLDYSVGDQQPNTTIPYRFQDGKHHVLVDDVSELQPLSGNNQTFRGPEASSSIIGRIASRNNLIERKADEGWALVPDSGAEYDSKDAANASAELIGSLGKTLPELMVTVSYSSTHSPSSTNEVSFRL